MRDLTQDKLASAERVAESQAKGMMGKANAPEKIRVPMIGQDGKPMYDKAGRAIMQDVIVDPAQEVANQGQSQQPSAQALEESLRNPGFTRFLGNKYIGKDSEAVEKISRARELEAGQYAAGAAPAQKLDDAVRKFTAGEGRAPTAQELADLRKQFGLS